jgi:foldase protein PrsA
MAVLVGLLPATAFAQEAATPAKPATPPKQDAQKPAPSDSEVLAIVNGERITRKQVADELMLVYGREALQWFIDRALIEQEARKANVDVTPQETQARIEKEIERLVNQIMRQYRIKTQAELAEFVKRQGGALETMKQRFAEKLAPQIRPAALEEKLLRLKVTVTPDEVREQFQKIYGPRLDAQQIVVATKKEADDLVTKVRAGADFAILAREHSLDSASKGSGGKLQPISSDTEIGRAMANLREGEVSDPVLIGEYYHVLRLNKRITNNDVKLAEVEAKIRSDMTDEKVDKLRSSWRAALKDKADIRLLAPQN